MKLKLVLSSFIVIIAFSLTAQQPVTTSTQLKEALLQKKMAKNSLEKHVEFKNIASTIVKENTKLELNIVQNDNYYLPK